MTTRYVDDLHLPQIISADTCTAALIDQTTLKNWISRKPPAVFLTENDRVLANERHRFRFSLCRVYQIALTAELVRMKLTPRDAAELAALFSDYGDKRRAPGELFPTGLTLLIRTSDMEFNRVINVVATEDVGLRPTSVIVVDVNSVVSRVRKALGLVGAA